jgi:hypothetical protein
LQTFLPYSDFEITVKCLDYKRLGKQRVEAHQILNILLGKQKSNAWLNHPCVKMWRGYEHSLGEYMNCCIKEWVKRGYNNTMKLYADDDIRLKNIIKYPIWLGNKKFHASHRSNLLRKNFDFYSKFNWEEKNDLPYYWPIKK